MNMQLSSKIKKGTNYFACNPFSSTLTAVLSGNAGDNYHTYYESSQPYHINPDEAPTYCSDGVPVFSEPPTGINIGDIVILNRRRSPSTPEGA